MQYTKLPHRQLVRHKFLRDEFYKSNIFNKMSKKWDNDTSKGLEQVCSKQDHEFFLN